MAKTFTCIDCGQKSALLDKVPGDIHCCPFCGGETLLTANMINAAGPSPPNLDITKTKIYKPDAEPLLAAKHQPAENNSITGTRIYNPENTGSNVVVPKNRGMTTTGLKVIDQLKCPECRRIIPVDSEYCPNCAKDLSATWMVDKKQIARIRQKTFFKKLSRSVDYLLWGIAAILTIIALLIYILEQSNKYRNGTASAGNSEIPGKEYLLIAKANISGPHGKDKILLTERI